jgi:hypothetical protein
VTRRLLLILLILSWCGIVLGDEKPMTNADVVALVEAGLGDEIIVMRIQQTKTAQFNFATDALVQLKKKKVSEIVMKAMLEWKTPESPQSASTTPVANREVQQPLPPSRKKGRLKSMFTRESEADEKRGEEEDKQRDAAEIGHTVDDACVKNFQRDGSFVAGYKYTTFAEIRGVTKARAFNTLAAKMASGGWQVISSDREAGIISASQGVVGTQPKTVPFNVVIRETTAGVRIDLTFQLGFGMVTSGTKVMQEFCGFIDAVH